MIDEMPGVIDGGVGGRNFKDASSPVTTVFCSGPLQSFRGLYLGGA